MIQPSPRRGGRRFGKYVLLDRLAVGGMAEIFLARQEGLEGFEKTVVIKRIRPHLSKQKSFVHMFLDEARLAAQLNHPNIVQIYDLGQLDDSYFIAMEYVFGRDMAPDHPQGGADGDRLPAGVRAEDRRRASARACTTPTSGPTPAATRCTSSTAT